MVTYKIAINNSIHGPMSEDQIFSYNVNENTPVFRDGGEWRSLSTYPELMSKLVMKRNYPSPYSSEVESKKTLCGVMAILLGGFGVQYYILGKVGGGLVTFLLTLVTCGMWTVLTVVQGIMMLTMSDEEFCRKYVSSTSFMPLF